MSNNQDTTTKFKVDISELKKSMQEAKRQVAIANSAFQETASTMDDWSKSSDGISAKLKQLGSNLKSQKSILADYEKQLELTKQQYPEGGKAVDDLIVKINKQKAVINNTEREISKYESTLSEVTEAEKIASKTGKDVADVLEDMGKEAKDADEGFTTLKGAIATFAGNALTGLANGLKDAVGSLFSLADETREYRTELGKLETAFTSAGHSSETATKTYKDLYAVLGDEGQATEAANHLAKLTDNQKDLEKWTTIATGVYGTFGDSLPIEGLTEAANETAKVGQVTGPLADALNWAGVSEDKFNESLKKCSNEQERQALITDTLNGLYSDAANKYKEVNKDIMDAQRAQSELTDATSELGAVAEPVMTSFKLMGASFIKELLPNVQGLGQGFSDLMNGVKGAENGIGSSISGLVTTVLNKITQILPQLANVAVALVNSLVTSLLGMLPQLTTTLITIINTLISQLGTILPQIVLAVVDVVPKIIDAIMTQLPVFINACVTFLMAIVQAIPQVVTAILDALPQLITSIIDGLMAGIDALLQGAVTLLMAIVDAIPTIVDSLIAALPQIINSLIGGLLNAIPDLLQGAITLLMAIIEAVPVIIEALHGSLPSIIQTIMNTLLDNLPLLLDTAVTLFMALVKAIPQIVKALSKALPQIITTVLKVMGQLLSNLGVFIIELMAKIGLWIRDIVKKGAEGASNFVKKVIENIKNLPSKMWNWLTQTVSKVASWGGNLASKGKEAAKKLFNAVVDKVKEIPSKLKSIGSDIVKGLWNGINDMTGWIASKIKGFGKSVTDGLKKFFKIKSPSRLMAEEVGRYLPEGIALGIDNNAKSVINSMRNLAVNTVSAAQSGLATGTVTSGIASRGSVVNNFNQYNYSPKSLTRLEIYRQSKNLLGFAGGAS